MIEHVKSVGMGTFMLVLWVISCIAVLLQALVWVVSNNKNSLINALSTVTVKLRTWYIAMYHFVTRSKK